MTRKTKNTREIKVWALLSGGEFRRVVQDSEAADMRKAIKDLGTHIPVLEIIRATLLLPTPNKGR